MPMWQVFGKFIRSLQCSSRCNKLKTKSYYSQKSGYFVEEHWKYLGMIVVRGVNSKTNQT